MQSGTLFILVALVAAVFAEGEYYVPRAYYTIDSEGHASAPVPLRRLRRSLMPPSYPAPGSSANANANAEANSWGGGSANANANANARAGSGGWGMLPFGQYGSSNPKTLSAGQYTRTMGTTSGRSVSAGSYVGVDSTGTGLYDQYTAVSK